MTTMDLPAGTHYARLTATGNVGHQPLTAHVVWADLPHDQCPSCKQPVEAAIGTCPVIINVQNTTGADLVEVPHAHQCCYCGLWDEPSWRLVDGPDGVRAAADELAAERAAKIEELRGVMIEELRRDVRTARQLLDDGEPESRVLRGTDERPGVYRAADGTLTAWAEGPVGTGPVDLADEVSA